MPSKLATRHIRTHNKPLKTENKPRYPQVPEKPPRKENEQPQEQLQVYAVLREEAVKSLPRGKECKKSPRSSKVV
jgi:hypothetical protein